MDLFAKKINILIMLLTVFAKSSGVEVYFTEPTLDLYLTEKVHFLNKSRNRTISDIHISVFFPSINVQSYNI